MNEKKAALSTIIGFIMLSAFLILILIYFFGRDAILDKIAEGANWIADNTLIGLKKDKFEKTAIESDKDVEQAYENILSALRSEGEGHCIIQYQPFNKNFKDFKISLSNVPEGTFVQLVNKKRIIVKHNTVSGIAPCIIGGGNSAQNFKKNYLDGAQCDSNCLNDYSIVNIEFRNGDVIYVNGEKMDIEDKNLLFKSRDGNICFFPTYSELLSFGRCHASEKGLNKNCINQIDTNMKRCSAAESLPAFFEGTFYGAKDEWRLIQSKYYYIGTDSRIAYMFRIESKDDKTLGSSGLYETEFYNIFSSQSQKIPSKNGAYYRNIYYDTKENWKYKEGGECNKCWVYIGSDGEVPNEFKTKGIVLQEKMVIFGPPREG